MTILFLSIEFNYCCGISRSIYTLASKLKSEGHRIILGCPGGSMINELSEMGIEYVEMPFYPEKKSIKNILRAVNLIYKTSKKFKVDIIHSHHRLPELLAKPVCYILGIASVTTCHAILKGKVLLSFQASRIIAVSDAVRINLISNFNISSNRIFVIPNIPRKLSLPSKEEIAEFKRMHDIPDGNFIVAGIGRLHYEKGFDLLLTSLKKQQEFKLTAILVGKGEEEDKLKQYANENKLDVIFIKETKHIEIIYATADVIIVPSRMESAGLVPIEASFFAKAVIAANVGGLSENIKHKTTGLLVSPEDPEEIMKAVRQLYYTPELREKIGNNLKRSIAENYSSTKIVNDLLSVYEKGLK